jgi:DNA-binding beta-propeller fold protein YncE
MRHATAVLLVSLAAACGVAAACSSTPSVGPSDAGKPDASTGTHDAGTDAHHLNDASAAADAAALPPLETTPPAMIPLASRRDATSSPIVYDTGRGIVWTANGDIGTVSYVGVDHGAQKVLEEVAVGTDIRSVALSPDGKWVAAVDRGAGTVALIDGDSRNVMRVLTVGGHPRSAVWDAANPRFVYVTVEDAGAVVVIDRTAGVVSQTVPVGRIPGGLAVSRQRRELYITHRIDQLVTTVSLTTFAVDGNVALADQPLTTPLTTPQGKPFAFDSVAWTTDGNTMWLPHELLAPTHPFQFTETLFPAISVVDFSGKGQEVQTDPNDQGGVIAGRKLLFGAINLLDATSNVAIVSQPCAVAMHPNGTTAYALACGSDDLLTFDLTQGIAIAILRNLPGSHPVGIALDATGARAFVLSDESQTLLTLDLAGGSLVTHSGEPTIIDGPLKLVAKDPLDPALRAGLTSFFSADSSAGTLITTGNNWISCGGCHLDGFGSPTLRLFESSQVIDAGANAQIGHSGLTDLFSTAPLFATPAFNPHDILVALEEQGGLVPDRTGADRTGAIDPTNPTAAATTMASQMARVIARDLPIGPSWLLPTSDAGPVEADDTKYCGSCHAKEYAAWKTSVHAHAADDRMVSFCVGTEQGLVGKPISKLCAGCHDPVNARLADTTFESPKGVTCLGCHEVSRIIRAGGNTDLQVTTEDWTKDHAARAAASLVELRKPEFCAGCHEQFVPGNGLASITTYNEWSVGKYANEAVPQTCVTCHATSTAGVADHSMPGGNVYLSTLFGETTLAAAEVKKLQQVMKLTPSRNPDGSVTVTLTNVGSGHAFPTGVTDVVEAWVELQAVDGSGNVLAHYGGPDPTTGLLPSSAARLGTDIADKNGTILYQHELSQAVGIPFDRRVPPGGSLDLTVTPAATLPSGVTELDAVLLYRNIRATYYQRATMATSGSVAAIEMARVPVPQ